MQLITYDDKPALLAGARTMFLAPHIQALPAGHPVLRFVLMLGVFERDVRAGVLPGPFTQARAELFARCALIDDDEFLARFAAGATDEQLAEHFEVPPEQIRAKHHDLLDAQSLVEPTERPR